MIIRRIYFTLAGNRRSDMNLATSKVFHQDALRALGQIADNNPSTVSTLLVHLADHSRFSVFVNTSRFPQHMLDMTYLMAGRPGIQANSFFDMFVGIELRFASLMPAKQFKTVWRDCRLL